MTKKKKKKLIEEIQLQIDNMNYFEEDMNSASWKSQKGILITGNEAEEFIRLLKKEL